MRGANPRWPASQGSASDQYLGGQATELNEAAEEQRVDARPVLLAVDDDPRARERIAAELRRRYTTDYRIFC